MTVSARDVPRSKNRIFAHGTHSVRFPDYRPFLKVGTDVILRTVQCDFIRTGLSLNEASLALYDPNWLVTTNTSMRSRIGKLIGQIASSIGDASTKGHIDRRRTVIASLEHGQADESVL